MSKLYTLTATLTNLGIALIAAAKTAGTKISITKVDYGNGTVAVSPNTTVIGTQVLLSSISNVASTNLVNTSVAVQALFLPTGLTAINGTIGIYSDTTLVAAVRLTLPLDANGGEVYVQMKFASADAAVFSGDKRNIVAMTAIGEVTRKADTQPRAFFNVSEMQNYKSVLGIAAGTTMSDFAAILNILENATEVSNYTSLNPPEGSDYWDLRDLKRYILTGGVWTAQSVLLSDVVLKGRMYFSPLTKRLFYAREVNELFGIAKFNT